MRQTLIGLAADATELRDRSYPEWREVTCMTETTLARVCEE